MAIARSVWLDNLRRRLNRSFSKFAPPPQVLTETPFLGHRAAR
jgi:hypothetical protein